MDDTTPPLPTDAPVTPWPIERTTPCLRCGYDLKGLRVDGTCPECGTDNSISYSRHTNANAVSGMAIASLVLGITSIPTCVMWGLPPLICGPLAIIFHRQAKKQVLEGAASPTSMGLANGGRICGIVGLTMSLAFWGGCVMWAILANP